MQYIIPHYYKKFVCIGGDCPDKDGLAVACTMKLTGRKARFANMRSAVPFSMKKICVICT